MGLPYELNPMATVVEGDVRDILEAAGRMHAAAFSGDVRRVLTTVKIDERTDKPLTMRGKLDAVRKIRGG